MSTQLHDTDLDLALARLVADGVVTSEQAAEVGALRDAYAAGHQAERAATSSRRGLIALASVGGVLIGVGVLTWVLAGWEHYGHGAQLALVWGAVAALLATASVVAVRTADGIGALRSPARRGRAGVVGTLGLLAEGLAAAGTAMAIEFSGAGMTWSQRGLSIALLCWTAAAVIACGVCLVAPGPLATLPAWACSLGVLLTGTAWALPYDTYDAFEVTDLALIVVALGLGALWAGAGPRFARPPMLATALGVATWLFAGISAGSMWPEQFRLAASTAECATYDEDYCDWLEGAIVESRVLGTLGLVALLVLVVVGFAVFVRRGGWPWAAGGVIAATAVTQILAQRTLGPAAAFVLAGLVLIGLSLAIGLRRRHRAATPDALEAPHGGPGAADLPDTIG